jgi:hypothetical protein
MWMAKGYFVCIMIQKPRKPFLADDSWRPPVPNTVSAIPPVMVNEWNGYYEAINIMSYVAVMKYKAEVVIAGSDKILPDTRYGAEELGKAFVMRFPRLFGVMHPVGDLWSPEVSGPSAQEGMGMHGRKIHATARSDQRCEGLWMGRRFILEMNGGRAPISPKYRHFFGDHELFHVARKLGILWQRSDVTQERIHWSRPGGPSMDAYDQRNFDQWYESDLAMWKVRSRDNFPGHEPYQPAAIVTPSKRIITNG